MPIDLPVSIKSCGTSSKQRTVEGKTYTNVAKKRNEIFIVSSMPNHKISNGENAVTGMYLIADTIGDIISFNGLIAQIRSAIGIAVAIDNRLAADIRVNEYKSPGINWPVSNRSRNAFHVKSGDGMNNGTVIIEPTCHMTSNIATPSIFFMLITSNNFVLYLLEMSVLYQIFLICQEAF
jgi:hypothetical protein